MIEASQFGEICIWLAERASNYEAILQSSIAFCLLAFISSVIFFGNQLLGGQKAEIFFDSKPNPDPAFPPLLLQFGFLAAWLPWIGISISLAIISWKQLLLAQSLAKIPSGFRNLTSIAPFDPGSHQLTAFILASAAIIVPLAGFFVCILLKRIMYLKMFQVSVVVMACVVFFVMSMAPLLFSVYSDQQPSTLVSTARFVGPMALAFAITIAFSVLVGFVAYLSTAVGFPLVLCVLLLTAAAISLGLPLKILTLIAALCLTVVALLALASRANALLILSIFLLGLVVLAGDQPAPSIIRKSDITSANFLKDAVGKWVDGRRDQIATYRARTNAKYPVFVVSAQGGGIYAAAAAAIFLARLQDTCPRFAQHIFAISGVSGGAVGSTLFQALVTRNNEFSDKGCSTQNAHNIEKAVGAILRDDHLSPLLSYLPANLLGTNADRAQGLAESFVASGAPFDLQLRSGYMAHWSPAAAAPALILNTTWAETGTTVAFAPFQFGVSDGASLSFSNTDIFGSEAMHTALIDAAVTSARFPGVVPPFVINRQDEGDPSAKLWNFVDGGYVDNSGALTALQVMQSIEKKFTELGMAEIFDVRLVMLSSSQPRIDPSTIYGTFAKDTVVPILTLLRVRERLGDQAIRRVVSELGDQSERDTLSEGFSLGQRWRAAIVELDDETFALPLGWRISDTTYHIISAMMGASRLCTVAGSGTTDVTHPTAETSDDKIQKSNSTPQALPEISIRRMTNNSCIAKSIEQLIQTN